jgi:hypothetical protein
MTTVLLDECPGFRGQVHFDQLGKALQLAESIPGKPVIWIRRNQLTILTGAFLSSMGYQYLGKGKFQRDV